MKSFSMEVQLDNDENWYDINTIGFRWWELIPDINTVSILTLNGTKEIDPDLISGIKIKLADNKTTHYWFL